tara:strand:+ start:417 stop:1151 length:735 start_codon:yes stop_codon:yes gene_type:complete
MTHTDMRLISRIDIKNDFVIKGVHLEGLRKLGNPNDFAKKYYKEGIDEIIFHDSVASLYERNNIFNVIENAVNEVYIPITISGGIRTIKDIEKALKSGADKIAINTQAVRKPNFVKEAVKNFGSQAIIGSVDFKKNSQGWTVLTESGRETTGLNALDWIKKLEGLGVGEILLTSVDFEGTMKGFDIEFIEKASKSVDIPSIGCGGAGNIDHIVELTKNTQISGVVFSSIIHYGYCNINNIREKI